MLFSGPNSLKHCPLEWRHLDPRLIRGSASQPPKRHLDRFSRFAGLTCVAVLNRQTDRQTTLRATSAVIIDAASMRESCEVLVSKSTGQFM